MREHSRQITVEEWDRRYVLLKAEETFPEYVGPLGRHMADGDLRLADLLFDDSVASLRLWNFLLTENKRLHDARRQGKKIVGTMKDLGTVPVLAYSFPDLVAFYPDGAWWIPCVMQLSAGLLKIADSLGIDDSFCPVRAMLGAFFTGGHFPNPDLLTCSVGAVCDDFSAIAQFLNGLGYSILWWEIPHRRLPEDFDQGIELPGGFPACQDQVKFVEDELERIKEALENLTGHCLSDEELRAGIRKANEIRRTLDRLRQEVYSSDRMLMPALEMLVAEMLAIHYCSDQDEAFEVLQGLLDEVLSRKDSGSDSGDSDAAKIYWINPVADLRMMNLLEQSGGRICGTEYLFSHALDEIPEDIEPMQALARMALADPMVGPAGDRAARVIRDIDRFGSEAVVISRIPGASHCAVEGAIIRERIVEERGLPVVEIEVPPLIDSVGSALKTRIEALVETVKERRL